MATDPLPQRRKLTFSSFADALREVDALRERGYDRAGKWGLGAVCHHVALWLTYALDGYPMKPSPWIVRATFGAILLEYIRRTRSMPSGVPTNPASVAEATIDEGQAIDELRKAIERFEHHSGDVVPSPLFGKMSKEVCRELHLIHCAHHLGFLTPRSTDNAGGLATSTTGSAGR
jgi:hypothetical protein